MQKKWKRLLLVVLAAITVFIASTVFAGAETADSKYELHDSSWYLSEEEARAFMGFIYNLGPDDLEEKEFAGLAVDLLSGKYADSPEDEYIIKAAVCEVALTQINSKVSTYDHASVISSENLISWLQSRVGDNPDEQYINSTCNGYLGKMKESLKKTILICNMTDGEYEAYEDFELRVSGYEDIYDFPQKIAKYVKDVKAGLEAIKYAGSSSRSAMYKYVLSYVKTRDLANSTVDGFELAMDYNVVALVNQGLYDPFLNWAAEDNQKVLNRFAELLYWLCEDIGGIGFVNDNASGNSTSTAEPVEFVPGTGVYKGSCGNNVQWLLDASTGVLSIYGSGSMYDYGSASRTPWYNNRQYINYVKVADGVTNVGNCAFSSCTFLDKVYLSADVVSIGNDAFSGCQSLRIIAIDGNVSNIGSYAFSNCSNLVYFKVPDGVTTVRPCTFYSCSKLVKVDFPSGLISIGDSAFCGCSGMVGKVILPDGLTSIGVYAFHGTMIESINIPDGITTIANYTFYQCTNLKSVSLSDSVTSIGAVAFSGCENLYDIAIPSGVTSIGGGAFSGCKSIEKIEIPDGVESLVNGVFTNCTGLKELSIPVSVKLERSNSYSYYPFKGCSNIEKIIFTKGNGTMYLYCSYSDFPTYISRNTLKEVIFEDGVKNIQSYTCFNCTALEKVTIPDSVTEIGDSAFCGCSGMVGKVILPDGLTSIGVYAFHGTMIESINIPDGITTIANYTFYQCTNLKSVSLSDSVTSIGAVAFSGCENLYDIAIPSGVTSIGGGAFSGCKSIEKIEIPDGVESLVNGVFTNCTGLKELSIPVSVKLERSNSYSYYPFKGCSNIEKIIFTKGNGTMYLYCSYSDFPTYISRNTLKEVIFEDGVKNIQSYTCFNCTAIEKVTIPDSVTEIGDYAFYNCTSLNELTIPNKDCTIFDSSSTVYSKTTIKAACGSKAYNYAVKYKRSFVSTEHTTSDWFADFLSDGETMTTNIYRQCIYCGEVLDLTTHITKGWIVDSAATCTQDGIKHLECLDCQRRIDTAIPALGHTPVTDPAVDATCTETGLTEGSHCSVCGEVLTVQEEIPAKGHTYGEYVLTTAPTCTKTGVETQTCSVCGDEQTRPVPALGHKEVTDPSVAPTCSEKGLTDGSHCSVCGEVLTAQEEIPALGHTDTNADGKCDNCGETMEAVKTCSCNCHQGGFKGFIYKFMRFFWKLFKTHQYCACGQAHY
ncbi:MAG: leucine-rich repeat domain-containing protein [Acutalibacteraceae bacterium]